MSKKHLTYGISDFEDVIENYYYIDKTMFIPKLEQEGEVYLPNSSETFWKEPFL